MSQINEKFGKDTLKALGTVLGVTKGARRAIKQREKEMPNQVSEAVDMIINKEFDKASELLEQHVSDILVQKVFEMKKHYAAKLSEQIVQSDGKVHTHTGERILPSVYRARRLSEARGTPNRSEYENFAPDSEKAMEKEERHGERRAKEIRHANLGISSTSGERTVRGPENIVDYKKRKDEYFNKAASTAVRIHGDNVEAAAEHMRGLVTGVENKHEPWMVHHEYDDLTKNDFEGHIRRRLRDNANVEAAATNPDIRARIDKRAKAKAKSERRRKEYQDVSKHAMAVFQAKKAGLPPPPKKGEKRKKVEIDDEIPF